MSDSEFEKSSLDLSELFGMEGAFAEYTDETRLTDIEEEETDLDGFLNSVARELTALSYLTMFNTLAMKEVIRLVTGMTVDEDETIIQTLEKLQKIESASGKSVIVPGSGNTAA